MGYLLAWKINRLTVYIMGQKKRILTDIIKNEAIYPVYQPIVSMSDGSIYGYEALTRIKQDAKYDIGIEEMFSLAEKKGMAWSLEELCRKKAIKGAKKKPKKKKLFLNVNPNVLLDKQFESGITLEFIEKYGLEPNDVVFEITERTPIQSKNLFKKVLKHYTNQGFSVAIDDFGSAYAGLDRLCYIKPDYLKLDAAIIRGIGTDDVKRSLVMHMIQFCKEVSIISIAEGVERKGEAEILKALGVDYVQGYYYACPSDKFVGNYYEV